MSVNYEIERKYLVKMPAIPIDGEVSVSDIVQTYLVSDAGTTERVRKRGNKYYYTKKVHVSAIRSEEYERELRYDEYNIYLMRRDRSLNVISKTRRVFVYDNQTFEIDIYPFWNDKAVLEIELESEDVPVKIPPFIEVIREVTDDLRYKNKYLAKSIPE